MEKTKFLIAIHHRDDYDPATEGPEIGRDIDDLNDEMVAVGVRVFVGGLHHASSATSVQLLPSGEVALSDGAYLKTDEHVGGFWVLEVASQEEAIAWGRKATKACRAPVEVRQFH